MRAGLGAIVLASSPCQYKAQPEYLLLRISVPGCRPLLLEVIYRPLKVGYLAGLRADFETLRYIFSCCLD